MKLTKSLPSSCSAGCRELGKAGAGAGGATGGVVASLMSKVAAKPAGAGLFGGLGKGSRGPKVDVNAGARASKDLENLFDQGQALLKMRHGGGGKMGFRC